MFSTRTYCTQIYPANSHLIELFVYMDMFVRHVGIIVLCTIGERSDGRLTEEEKTPTILTKMGSRPR